MDVRGRTHVNLRNGTAVLAAAVLGLAGCGSAGSTDATGPAGTTAAAPGGTAVASTTTAGTATAAPSTPPVSSPSSTPASSPSSSPSSTPSSTTPAADPSAAAPSTVSAGPVLRRGDKGAAVLAVQNRLGALGYWLGTPRGVYDDNTVHAVTALQKAAGLSRDGVLGAKTRAALAAGVRPTARTSTGHAIEVDLKRQLLLVVDDGKVGVILDTSTGSGAWYRSPGGTLAHATTPVGSFSPTWRVNGWHTAPLGHLYRPIFFHPRGIAVHGYTSVPAYPASHGCVRVTLAAMDLIWSRNLMPNGSTVRVY